MEHKSPDFSHGGNTVQEATESNDVSEMIAEGVAKPVSISPTNNSGTKTEEWRGGEVLFNDETQEDVEAYGEVNTEASISPEDVVRAGGFGARDDISSFLPVASDSTDFEASIRDARDYEETEGKVSRPGLGWSKESKPE